MDFISAFFVSVVDLTCSLASSRGPMSTSYMNHHIGVWTHRPASPLIALHRIRSDNEKPEDIDFLTALRINDRQSLTGLQTFKTYIHH